MCVWRSTELEPEAPKTSQIELFDIINDEQQEQKHAADQFFRSLLDRYGSRGFVVIGFKFDTMRDMEDPLQFASKIGVCYPLAVGTEDVKHRFGGIEGLPTTMLYDRQGILRTKVIGFEYTDNIEQALKPFF
jgi:hypothetical protein